jgi:hypothetical protein
MMVQMYILIMFRARWLGKRRWTISENMEETGGPAAGQVL